MRCIRRFRLTGVGLPTRPPNRAGGKSMFVRFPVQVANCRYPPIVVQIPYGRVTESNSFTSAQTTRTTGRSTFEPMEVFSAENRGYCLHRTNFYRVAQITRGISRPTANTS